MTDQTNPSHSNPSGLDVPPEFKVEVSQDFTVPIDSEMIYRTALRVMYAVSDIGLRQTWLDRDWSSSDGESGIFLEHRDFGGKFPSKLETRHVIWGFNYMLLAMTLSRQYCQTIAVLKWEGAAVGAIYVARRASFGLAWDAEATNQTDDALQLLPQDQDRAGANEAVELSVSYAGATPIDRDLIYLTAIKAMGDAAEQGLDQPVPAIITTGIRKTSWELLSGAGTASFPGILRPRHSRFAVFKTVFKLIEDDRFQKIYVWLKVDGINTAAGGFSQGEIDVTTS